MATRPAAVAGTWYPANPKALAHDVDGYLDAVPGVPDGEIRAIIAPHAGLMFSGPIGAYVYKAIAAQHYDVAVLIGPSHYIGFDGVAIYPEGAFDTPLGPAVIDQPTAATLSQSGPIVSMPEVHAREHSLEMQLPFLRRVCPDLRIVPLLMGAQRRSTIEHLAICLAGALRDRQALLIGSTDLSHYFDARTAASLDGEVVALVDRFDVDGLMRVFEGYPENDRGRFVGCGMGPALSVMIAARMLGARSARVLRYGHSGEISGDHDGVVGYMAAAIGNVGDWKAA
jgi:AmmeMemoRadiSam system protein B